MGNLLKRRRLYRKLYRKQRAGWHALQFDLTRYRPHKSHYLAGDSGDRDVELHSAQGLQSLHHGGKPPSPHLFLELLLDALYALHKMGDRVHVFLEHDSPGLGWQRHIVGQPPKVRGVPVRFAAIADVVAQKEGLQALFCDSQIAGEIFACAAQIPYRLVYADSEIAVTLAALSGVTAS
jgi:hypothetical protein